MKLPKNYSLFEAHGFLDFPVEELYISNFNMIPSSYISSMEYSYDVRFELIRMGYVEFYDKSLFDKYANVYNHNRLFINRGNRTIVKLSQERGVRKENETQRYSLTFYYDLRDGEITKQVSFEQINKFGLEKTKIKIYLIREFAGHLDVDGFELLIPSIDLDLNYGKGFTHIHETIAKRLNNNNDKGIVLLHGDPGSGKTTYIKYLTNCVTDKEIIFVPPSMAEVLSEPSIIPFLMDHKNSILIIEDAEKVISDRKLNGSSAGVSNILNLTDGILGDCLNIQIIATFNMEKEKIDEALLRKGRLIAEHKFGKLSVDDSNKLLEHLNKNHTTIEKMTLSDIYNIDEETIKSEDNSGKIGFYAHN